MQTSFENAFRSLLSSVLSEVVNELLPPLATRPKLNAERAEGEQTSLLMTPREVAKALAISARTLWTLTQAGGIPSLRIGRLVRYEADAVRKWVKDASGRRQIVLDPDKFGKRARTPRATGELQPNRVVKGQQRSATKSRNVPPVCSSRYPASTPEGQRAPEADCRTKPRSVSAFFAERLGVNPDRFARLTNGELMRIAGVDIATMHGWIYLNCDLPDAAIERLQAYFAAELKRTTGMQHNWSLPLSI